MRIVLIGCGGIGGAVAPVLCRFLYAERRRTHILFVDGDTYERKNEARMALAWTRANKAIALAGELAEAFGRVLTIESVPEFVTPDRLPDIVQNGDVVFLAVDNHRTRKQVADHVAELDDVTLISGGNDGVEHGEDGCFGSVQIVRRADGRNLTSRLDAFHPEIAEPADRSPGEVVVGCEDLAESSAPQLLFTNVFVSAVMLNAFYGWLRGTLRYEEVYLDAGQNRVQPVERQGEA